MRTERRITKENNNLFDDIFDEFFIKPYMVKETKTKERVLNRDEDWQIVFAIPGVKKDQVSINVENSVLSVKYDNENDNDYFSFVTSFYRSWKLQPGVDLNKITAKHEDGILTITVPKPEAQKQVIKTIEVQ